MRSPARTTTKSPGSKSSTMDLDFIAVAQHAGMVGQLVYEAMNRPFGPPGGPCFQPLAEKA